MGPLAACRRRPVADLPFRHSTTARAMRSTISRGTDPGSTAGPKWMAAKDATPQRRQMHLITRPPASGLVLEAFVVPQGAHAASVRPAHATRATEIARTMRRTPLKGRTRTCGKDPVQTAASRARGAGKRCAFDDPWGANGRCRVRYQAAGPFRSAQAWPGFRTGIG